MSWSRKTNGLVVKLRAPAGGRPLTTRANRKDVLAKLQELDRDGDGTVDLNELEAYIEGAVRTRKEVTSLRRIVALVGIILMVWRVQARPGLESAWFQKFNLMKRSVLSQPEPEYL